jgi:hypothetical protein
VEWKLTGETEVLGENLPQCHFAHHKYHMTWPELEPAKPATNRLSYGTASWNCAELKRKWPARYLACYTKLKV